ncbi:sulfurtransferase TusA family protein [uncultured Shewanella sp.]|uniref:sulfurtransferase TusA family protein n=1 Tax=uncultured Shewanella sp. TaxID=173975 RepID=UPI002616E555|nr:sulfurtransferase TusA family protein [uncultured Shewanella sp.]
MNIIDLTNDVCPLALVKFKLALKQLQPNQSLIVLLSDTGSKQDVPLFLKKKGYCYETVIDQGVMRLSVSL